MATWTNITNAALEPGKPIRSVDGIALRDNPVAIAEGASGAPRVEDPALDTTATNTGRDWVLARTALASLGALGTYALCEKTSAGTISPGTTVPGSELYYSSGNGAGVFNVRPSGTWRALGESGGGGGTGASVTVYLRIA